MKGIVAISEDTGYSSARVSSEFRFWELKNGKVNPNYEWYYRRPFKFLTFGEAKKFFHDNELDKHYLLVSKEEFQKEVKRRKDIVKNDFVFKQETEEQECGHFGPGPDDADCYLGGTHHQWVRVEEYSRSDYYHEASYHYQCSVCGKNSVGGYFSPPKEKEPPKGY